MKALCIQDVGDGFVFQFNSDEPIIGRYYFIEDATKGTKAQNSAFHSLLTEYWKSGLHSYNASDFKEFKKQIKRYLGQGFEKYKYATVQLKNGKYKPLFHEAKTYDEIPEEIRTDPDFKDFIQGFLKSWSDYTLKQRKDTIDNLISEMNQAGVNSKKYFEILEGMQN